MGNCLKTQLKEVVNNDNLLKFNALRLHIKPTTSDQWFGLQASEENTCVISTLNGEHFVAPDSNSVVINALEPNGVIPNHAGDIIDITNKSKLIEATMSFQLLASRNNYEYDLDFKELNYMPLLQKIMLPLKGNLSNWTPANPSAIISFSLVDSEDVVGSYETFAAFINLYSTTIAYCPLTGSIKNLGGLTSLTECTFDHTGLSDAIEDFVALQVYNTRTSANIIMNVLNTDVTWKGSLLNGGGRLIWEPSGNNTVITLGEDTTTIHVNNDGTWTRVS